MILSKDISKVFRARPILKWLLISQQYVDSHDKYYIKLKKDEFQKVFNSNLLEKFNFRLTLKYYIT